MALSGNLLSHPTRRIHPLHPQTPSLSSSQYRGEDLIQRALLFRNKLFLQIQPRRIFLKKWEELAHSLTDILKKFHLGEEDVAAGLLFDAFSYAKYTTGESRPLEPLFSPGDFPERTLKLCRQLSSIPPLFFDREESKGGKVSPEKNESEKQQKVETYRRMLISSSIDIENLLLLMGFRLYQLKNIYFYPLDVQFQIAREAREVYAPLANRLGISWLKNELEDLSLRYLYPRDYYYIVRKISSTKKERQEYIQLVIGEISKLLESAGIKGRVMGRPKHINSIFLKMLKRGVPFEKLYDIVAFRVICSTKSECYEILSLIHAKWKPIPGRFKDYISRPKENNYQSLHTSVIGPQQKQMEVQIRTEEMHTIAEEGIAAHCLYKEGRSGQKAKEEISWLRKLLRRETSPQKTPLAEKIFVQTPKGEVKELKKGSTPLDFAYSIHTEVGHRCAGAKVNGKIVPFSYELQNGDVVEIITSPSARPNQSWLQYVKSSRAKAKIRAFLRAQKRREAILEGQLRLEKALPKANRNLTRLRKTGKLDQAREHFGLRSIDDLFAQIGFGKLREQTVAKFLFPQPEELSTPSKDKRAIQNRALPTPHSVIVAGYKDVMTRFARCCAPSPGEPILGFVSKGRGIIIHNQNCPRVKLLDPERIIDVSWRKKNSDLYKITLQITANSKNSVHSEVSKIFSKNRSRVTSHQWKRQNGLQVGTFSCQLEDLSQLDSILEELKKLSGVVDVKSIRKK